MVTRRQVFRNFPALRAGPFSLITGYIPDFVGKPVPEIFRETLFDALVKKAEEYNAKKLTAETLPEHLFARAILELNAEPGGRDTFFHDYIGSKQHPPQPPKEMAERALRILTELQNEMPDSNNLPAEALKNKPGEAVFDKADAVRKEELEKLEDWCRKLIKDCHTSLYCLRPFKGKKLGIFERQQLYAKQALVHVYEDAGALGVILTLEAAGKACIGDTRPWNALFEASEVDADRIARTFGQAINTANETGETDFLPNHRTTFARRNAFGAAAFAAGGGVIAATTKKYDVSMFGRKAEINKWQAVLFGTFVASLIFCRADADAYVQELDANMKTLLTYIGSQSIKHPLKITLPVNAGKTNDIPGGVIAR